MNGLLRRLGGWRALVGLFVAAAVVGLPVGFIVADQLARTWTWADGLLARALVMGAMWAALVLWALRERRW